MMMITITITVTSTTKAAALGAGEQILTRQMFRLGELLTLPECLTFYYAHVGCSRRGTNGVGTNGVTAFLGVF